MATIHIGHAEQDKDNARLDMYEGVVYEIMAATIQICCPIKFSNVNRGQTRAGHL